MKNISQNWMYKAKAEEIRKVLNKNEISVAILENKNGIALIRGNNGIVLTKLAVGKQFVEGYVSHSPFSRNEVDVMANECANIVEELLNVLKK